MFGFEILTNTKTSILCPQNLINLTNKRTMMLLNPSLQMCQSVFACGKGLTYNKSADDFDNINMCFPRRLNCYANNEIEPETTAPTVT